MFTSRLLLATVLFLASSAVFGAPMKDDQGKNAKTDNDDGCRFGRRFRQSMPIFLSGRDCCVDAGGQEHEFGEKWLMGHLMYECNDGGYEITGCQVRPGMTLKPGEDYVEDNVAFRCYRTQQGTHTVYSQYNCGLGPNQPSCDLEKEPINVQPVGFGKFEPNK